MRKSSIALVACAALGLAGWPAESTGVAYVHGRWFDGARFVAETVYVVDGRLRRQAPESVAETVDLGGGYVLPPFADAHNHDVSSDRYLAAGVFYVKNPNNRPADRRAAAPRLGRPDAIDAVFANGGLTATGGHPSGLARRAIDGGAWAATDGEGVFYHAIDGPADLDRKWPAILAGRPDFLKTYLLFSEQLEARRAARFDGRRGLDPALLPAIVERAHRAGLRVTTHVESAADFHHAVAAGVDEIAHLPGFRGPDDESVDPRTAFAIAAEDARHAAEAGTVVVTTVGGVAALAPDGPMGAMRRAADASHARNLALLAAHGVRIAIGSDSGDDTSVGEALYLHGLGVFDAATLLRIWCSDTARSIFPGRSVGSLDDGAEASFIVLAGDPLVDFTQVRQVVLAVKQGVPYRPRAAAGGARARPAARRGVSATARAARQPRAGSSGQGAGGPAG